MLVVALLIGAALGFVMGCIIHFFEIQPFIVTLAGMFFARGLCYVISTVVDPDHRRDSGHDVAQDTDPLRQTSALAQRADRPRRGADRRRTCWHYTRLGRNVYAIGGNEQSALLMGLPVGRTKIAVYTISGLCSALGGILLSFYTLSGSPLIAVGMELDAIAAVVIGGTLLTGGSGYVFGTVLGVLVLG